MAGIDEYTLLCIQSETTDGSTTFTDSSPNEVEIIRYGSVAHDTDYAKFGSSSIYFPSTTHYLYTGSSISLGTADFTLDMWVRPHAAGVGSSTQKLFSLENDTAYFGFVLSSGVFVYYNGTIGWNQLASSETIVRGEWQHIALVRESGYTTFYYNGVAQETLADSHNFSAQPVYISFSSAYFCGHIEEYRLSSVARWSDDFTPPTEAYNDLEPITVEAELEPLRPIVSSYVLTGIGINAVISPPRAALSASSVTTVLAVCNLRPAGAVIRSLGANTVSYSPPAPVISSYAVNPVVGFGSLVGKRPVMSSSAVHAIVSSAGLIAKTPVISANGTAYQSSSVNMSCKAPVISSRGVVKSIIDVEYTPRLPRISSVVSSEEAFSAIKHDRDRLCRQSA